jgi:hypothetical protein
MTSESKVILDLETLAVAAQPYASAPSHAWQPLDLVTLPSGNAGS